jgi:hypothetical protein
MNRGDGATLRGEALWSMVQFQRRAIVVTLQPYMLCRQDSDPRNRLDPA